MPFREVEVRKTCHICYGMGLKETPRGDTIDCPNRSCIDGYIKVKEVIEVEEEEEA